MPFITQGKTNWKFLLIVIILAIIVGGGALWCSLKRERPYQPLQIKKPEKIEVTEELANKIIDKIALDTKKYDREKAKFFINNLNNDKTPEIIVCLATPASLTWEAGEIEAYMTVVIPTDKNGDYKTIGDFVFNKERGTPFLGRPCVAGVDESGKIYGYGEDIYGDRGGFVDIDGDGKKEMIVNLGLLGASGSAYTIFKIDWDLHKINRIKARNKEESIEDYLFFEAFALMHRAGFHLEDLDNDKTMEIVEIYDSLVESKNEANLIEKNAAGEELYWKREYVVYKWDGSILTYNEELSNLLLETMNWKTYRNEEYGFEIKYPNQLSMKETYISEKPPSGIHLVSENKDYLKGTIWIRMFAKDERKSEKECIDKEQDYLSYDGQKVVNSIIFYHYVNYPEHIGLYCGMSAGCNYKDLYRTFYNGNCYQIEYSRYDREFIEGNPYDPESKTTGDVTEIPKLFNQILSTFRFLE